MKRSFYREFGKRAVDLTAACVLLVALSPVLLVVSALVRLFHGAPILYRQVRAGKDGKPFQIYKFRTMTDACDDDGKLLSDAKRLTRFGQFLRSSSLDELPELWNVVRGEMSLVGPRPLLMQYLPLYDDQQARRHEVLPGITGLAQVRGRNAISWEQRFDYDVQYVDQVSLKLDLRILLDTASCVLRRDGITAESHATCPPFEGTMHDHHNERAAA